MKINIIKELRIINNIKQESIAKYLNYSQNRYSEIENTLKYDIHIYIKLSLLYNVNIYYLKGITNTITHLDKETKGKIIKEYNLEKRYQEIKLEKIRYIHFE